MGKVLKEKPKQEEYYVNVDEKRKGSLQIVGLSRFGVSLQISYLLLVCFEEQKEKSQYANLMYLEIRINCIPLKGVLFLPLLT